MHIISLPWLSIKFIQDLNNIFIIFMWRKKLASNSNEAKNSFRNAIAITKVWKYKLFNVIFIDVNKRKKIFTHAEGKSIKLYMKMKCDLTKNETEISGFNVYNLNVCRWLNLTRHKCNVNSKQVGVRAFTLLLWLIPEFKGKFPFLMLAYHLPLLTKRMSLILHNFADFFHFLQI